MPETDLVGVLFIGDPHLASRVPGFRSDDYPRAILDKLTFALEYAKGERLLPVLLGDLFEFPRDNANWLLSECGRLLGEQFLSIYGNHDCKENTLGDNDSLGVLASLGCIRLLDAAHPWSGEINGCRVVIGGTSWGQKLPEAFDRSAPAGGVPAFVLWATHHDLPFPGNFEIAREPCNEIPGIDLIVNGHLHRNLDDVVAGMTRWMNPGNIARISRRDATRNQVPGVLRVDVSSAGLKTMRVPLPHRPFEEVFHQELATEPALAQGSAFIQELARLQSVQTAGGVGLRDFLEANLPQFDPRVAAQIRLLADEVLSHAN